MTDDRHGRDVPALTALRGFAAWWVVLYHIRPVFAPFAADATMAFLAKGYLAVDMFFVLSGFVIYLNYANRLSATWGSFADFLVRRIARVYPLHLLILFAAVAYAALVSAREAEPLESYRLGDFVLNLFLIQNWGLTDRLSWNVPAWSISTELAAYLVFPLIPLVLRIRRWPTGCLVAGIAVILAALHYSFALQGAQELGWNIPKMGLLRCVTQFACGALLCEIYVRLLTAPRAALSAALIFFAGVLAFGVVGLSWPETMALPAVWATLILGLALWPQNVPNPLRWRPFVYLGDISYGTYLCHYLGFILFKLLFVEEGEVTAWPWVAAFIVATALVSAALYHAFERPAQRWIMYRWRAWVSPEIRSGQTPPLPPGPGA